MSKVPFIPNESEIDQLIDACSGSGALLLQIMKDTGCTASDLKKLNCSVIDRLFGSDEGV